VEELKKITEAAISGLNLARDTAVKRLRIDYID
jgi:hypothetical protein